MHLFWHMFDIFGDRIVWILVLFDSFWFIFLHLFVTIFRYHVATCYLPCFAKVFWSMSASPLRAAPEVHCQISGLIAQVLRFGLPCDYTKTNTSTSTNIKTFINTNANGHEHEHYAIVWDLSFHFMGNTSCSLVLGNAQYCWCRPFEERFGSETPTIGSGGLAYCSCLGTCRLCWWVRETNEPKEGFPTFKPKASDIQ